MSLDITDSDPDEIHAALVELDDGWVRTERDYSTEFLLAPHITVEFYPGHVGENDIITIRGDDKHELFRDVVDACQELA